jgi:hypothetical protein
MQNSIWRVKLLAATKIIAGMIFLQLMIAWWRKFGGWVNTQSSGTYGISLPSWLLSLIGNTFIILPSLVLGIIGWVLTISAYSSIKTDDQKMTANFTLFFPLIWSVLFFVMLVFGASILPNIFKFPF